MGISPRLATVRYRVVSTQLNDICARGAVEAGDLQSFGEGARAQQKAHVPSNFFSCIIELLARNRWWTEFLECVSISESSMATSVAEVGETGEARVAMVDVDDRGGKEGNGWSIEGLQARGQASAVFK